MRQRRFSACLFLFVFVAVISLSGSARAQLVTWVKPSGSKQPELKIQSRLEEVNLKVFNGRTGQRVRTLAKLGWEFEEFTLGKVLRASGNGRADTRPVKLTIEQLPPGHHEVYVRYWSRAPGSDQQWYALKTALGDDEFEWSKWDNWDWLVNGTGGYRGALYDRRLGTVGSKSDPVRQVTVRFDRYKWGRVARFGGVRIETTLNAGVPKTGTDHLSADERRVRKNLLSRAPGDLGMATAPASVKIRPKTFDALTDVNLKKKFSIRGARGEYVNRQLVLFNPERDLNINRLSTGPLKHRESDRTIGSGRILFAPVGYLYLDRSYDMNRHGWWPEPILRFMNGNFTVRKGDVQALWLRVHLPRDAPAGTYAGHVSVRPSDGPSLQVPVRARVRNFTIPKSFSLRTATSTSFVEKSEGGEEFLLSYGLNPGGLYRSSPPAPEDLRRWAEFGEINAFNVRYLRRSYMDGKNGQPTPEQLDSWIKQTEKCLSAAGSVGLREKAYFYMFDEAGDEAIPAMRAVSEELHSRFPDLLLLTTAHVYGGHGNTEKLPHLDGWCPRIPNYDFEEAREARRKHDREVWWYTANTPRPPYASMWTTQSAMSHRLLMGFMARAYHTDGFLYWRADKYWRREQSDIDSGPYVRDGWPVREHGQFIQRGPNGPIPSIRLEMFRDGLEDYEYLRIAKKQMDALSGCENLPDDLRRLRSRLEPYYTPGNDLVKNFRKYARTPRKLHRVRRKLARFIERARQFRSGDDGE